MYFEWNDMWSASATTKQGFRHKDTNNAKRAPRGFAGHMIGSHEALENARTFVNFSLSC